jgi:hypothetical protein
MDKKYRSILVKIIDARAIADTIVAALESHDVNVTEFTVKQVYLDIMDDIYGVAEKNIERRIEEGNFKSSW